MKSSYMLGIYGTICLLFAAIFSADVSNVETKTLSGKGGVFGPLIVKDKNSSYEVSIKNYVPLNKWSYVEIGVLDDNKEHLFSFGDEMWHESGYDSDGQWVESKTDYSMDITFKKAGQYYFDVGSERNDGNGNSIVISAVKERGSNVLFLVLGVLSLIIGGVIFYFKDQYITNEKTKGTRVVALAIILIILFVWVLFYSIRGWGYMGYRGYHHGPSFFYMGGPSIYHQPSNRDGSISGPGHRGGGFSGGK